MDKHYLELSEEYLRISVGMVICNSETSMEALLKCLVEMSDDLLYFFSSDNTEVCDAVRKLGANPAKMRMCLESGKVMVRSGIQTMLNGLLDAREQILQS